MPSGIYKRTEENRRNLSESHKGKKLSEEHKQYLSEIKKGTKPKGCFKKGVNHPFYGKHFSKEHKRKISEAQRGSRAFQWKGGISAIHHILRNSAKYRQWRMDCFIRDNFTCQKCLDNSGGNLEVHHRKSLRKLLKESKTYLPLFDPFQAAMFYSPLWDLDNGVTLCKRCHDKKRPGRPKKYRTKKWSMKD